MGDYHLETHMFSISMGGFDNIFCVEWLHTLGAITMDYQYLYMIFTQESHTCTLRVIQARSPKIIISHRMEKLFNKGDHGAIS
jgi:hypothetical protein